MSKLTGIRIEMAIQETLEMSCMGTPGYKIIEYKTFTCIRTS